MESVKEFIEKRLKLKVNREKSAVDNPGKRKFLGFSFYRRNGIHRIGVHPKPIKRLKEKLKVITSRSNGWSIEVKIMKLNQVITGWVNDYSIAYMQYHCKKVDEWLRRRLRMCIWKQWKQIGTRHMNLVKLGIASSKALEYANTRKGYWHTANSHILACSLTNSFFCKLGLIGLSDAYSKSLSLRTAECRTARSGGVRGQ